MRNYFKPLFLFSIGMAVSLLLIEGILTGISISPLGKVLPLAAANLGRPNKDIGYAFRPNAEGMWTRENKSYVSINSLGHRDKNVNPKKPLGVVRVALMGDSFTEALQVEHNSTFEQLTEAQLNSNGHSIEIINLAMSGNGPLRQLVRLEHFGMPLTPDIVVFKFASSGFVSGEMFDDSENPAYRANNDGTLERSFGFRSRLSQRMMDKSIGKIFLFLLDHSHIFRILDQKRKGSFLKFVNLKLPEWRTKTHATARSKTSKCNSGTFSKQYDFWVNRVPLRDWLAVNKFSQELKRLSLRSVIMPRLPLAHKRCNSDQKKRVKIIAEMANIFELYGFTFVDENTEIAKIMNLGPYAHQTLQNLRGFGLALGRGHLNYQGHRVHAQVLERVLEKLLPDKLTLY